MARPHSADRTQPLERLRGGRRLYPERRVQDRCHPGGDSVCPLYAAEGPAFPHMDFCQRRLFLAVVLVRPQRNRLPYPARLAIADLGGTGTVEKVVSVL